MPRPPFRSAPPAAASALQPPRHGLARVLSKLGACSRSQAEQWVRDGRVSVEGRVVRDPYHPTLIDRQRVAVDGQVVKPVECVYVAFNKPRGLVVSASDEHGRATVYTALAAAGLPWLGPVGRLDKASEGLLLLSNDTSWASAITDPATHLDKTYHVQVAGRPDASTLEAMLRGVEDADDRLVARRASLLRTGEKNAWLEVVLDEGRNRHIRRLLAVLGFDVLRLIRVAIGPLALGGLAKGQWRRLSADEVRSLAAPSVR
ncbi:rRNA pseudouridine synthase [Rhodanobacter denitrificans]|uniref:Pseudouridine synthase n=1 Tax=Rhodanobacter denitrificans TaxID=666685 RepID=A0A368KG94_9GAMM|nr:pseudouridine synthase [Rhodanobacter denitrificans]RCS30146.1 rRNA pseudouridine synthase [Rhodanobacter denitrificans]